VKARREADGEKSIAAESYWWRGTAGRPEARGRDLLNGFLAGTGLSLDLPPPSP
jgi:hypothetical protein